MHSLLHLLSRSHLEVLLTVSQSPKMFSDVLFCPTNSPKHKKTLHLLPETFKKLEPVDVWELEAWKPTETIRTVCDYISFDRLIVAALQHCSRGGCSGFVMMSLLFPTMPDQYSTIWQRASTRSDLTVMMCDPGCSSYWWERALWGVFKERKREKRNADAAEHWFWASVTMTTAEASKQSGQRLVI